MHKEGPVQRWTCNRGRRERWTVDRTCLTLRLRWRQRRRGRIPNARKKTKSDGGHYLNARTGLTERKDDDGLSPLVIV